MGTTAKWGSRHGHTAIDHCLCSPLVGAVFFGVQASVGERYALLAAMAVLACAIAATIGCLQRMRSPSLATTAPSA